MPLDSPRIPASALLLAALALLTAVTEARASEPEHGPATGAAEGAADASPLGIPMSRHGSGTAWQPDGSPVFGAHATLGRWNLMGHGNLFVGLDAQGSERGAVELAAINWLMGMLSGPLAGGEATARAMFSLEPWTVRNGGYPLLLQTGESYEGEPLHDRQHPHDLFMELALSYAHPLGDGLAASFYAGLPGEPALGPNAYPHRPSAWDSPFAPIGHHWQDATHIAFGVLTAGLYTRRVRLEGSLFNGREPDERRADIELHPLDSYSGRLQVACGEGWCAQLSAGRLVSPERLWPGEDQTRLTASLSANRRLAGVGNLAGTLLWGVNAAHGQATHSGLLEGGFTLPGGSQIATGRFELVQKSGEELVLESDEVHLVGQLSFGWRFDFRHVRAVVPGIGATAMISLMPSDLERSYGSRLPLGAMVYLGLRPAPMRPESAPAPPSAPAPGHRH